MKFRSLILFATMALLLPLGCKGEDDKGTNAGESEPGEAMGTALDGWITGGAPDIPPPLEGLRFEMPESEVDPEHLKGYRFKAAVGRVSVSVETEGPGNSTAPPWVDMVRISMPTAGALDMLTEQWGTPVVHERVGTDGKAETRHLWFNSDANIRARVEPNKVNPDKIAIRFEPWLSQVDVIGTGRGNFSFGKTPVLGATPKALREDWGVRYIQGKDEQLYASLDLPPTEYEDYATRVSVDITAGVVSRCRFSMNYRDAENRGEVLEMLHEKFGAFDLPADERISVSLDSADLSVEDDTKKRTLRMALKAK